LGLLFAGVANASAAAAGSEPSMTTKGPVPGGYRNPQLDGLRAFAALAVATFHSILELDSSQIQRILPGDIWSIPGLYGKIDKVVLAIVNGQTAVVVFFVLSGAVLFGTLERLHAGPAAGSADFTIRRLFRIYPTLFVCLVLFSLVVVAMGGRPSGAQFWRNALLIDNPIQGESWTLQAEILAVPFILMSFYLGRIVGVAGIIAVFLSTWLLFKTPWLDPYLGHQRTYTLCFVLGFLIPSPTGARVAAKFPTRAWPLVLVAMIGARHLIPVRIHSMNTDPVTMGLLFASAGLLVTLLYYRQAGGLGAFLQRPLATYLGRMSYSFYLYNVIFIRILSTLLLKYTPAREHPLAYGLPLSAAVIACTIPVAWLSERYVERPTIALGRRVARFCARSSGTGNAAEMTA
jgi:peptidoglycan/LPS O-acetylase OafA/YrhL